MSTTSILTFFKKQKITATLKYYKTKVLLRKKHTIERKTRLKPFKLVEVL